MGRDLRSASSREYVVVVKMRLVARQIRLRASEEGKRRKVDRRIVFSSTRLSTRSFAFLFLASTSPSHRLSIRPFLHSLNIFKPSREPSRRSALRKLDDAAPSLPPLHFAPSFPSSTITIPAMFRLITPRLNSIYLSRPMSSMASDAAKSVSSTRSPRFLRPSSPSPLDHSFAGGQSRHRH